MIGRNSTTEQLQDVDVRVKRAALDGLQEQTNKRKQEMQTLRNKAQEVSDHVVDESKLDCFQSFHYFSEKGLHADLKGDTNSIAAEYAYSR